MSSKTASFVFSKMFSRWRWSGYLTKKQTYFILFQGWNLLNVYNDTNAFWHTNFTLMHFGIFFVFCRKSIILLGATLIPPSLKSHGGPDWGSPNCAGSPRRQIRFLLRAPSREDTLPPGSRGRKKRCAGKSVLEPAGDFSNLEPIWNGGQIPIFFPSKLAGEPTLLAVPGFDLVTSWQLKPDHDMSHNEFLDLNDDLYPAEGARGPV